MSETETTFTRTIQFGDESRLTIKLETVPGDGHHAANQAYHKLLDLLKEIERSDVKEEQEELRGWCKQCLRTTWHKLRDEAWFCEVCGTRSTHSLDTLL